MRRKSISSSKLRNSKNFILNHLNNNLNQFYNYLSQKFIVLKKGFTLVELSIVLLVLALLVSTLLVGRQIIDRAKVQQVISEIDYYTKNFQMFRDQYDFLPGGLGEENCRKYPEFSMQKGDDDTKYDSQCDDPVSMLGGSATRTYTSYKQANFSIVDMVNSGMIENRSPGERRRKKFDIAEKQETTCVEVPAIRGDYYAYKCDQNSHVGDLDFTRRGDFFYYCSSDGSINTIFCDNRRYVGGADGLGGGECSGISNTATCSTKPKFDNGCGAYYKLKCETNTTQSIQLFHCYGTQKNAQDYIHYKLPAGSYLPLSPYGMSFHQNEKTQECETKTIPGEPRFGYLLKQEEIENQANQSSFDNKTWISYTGGKVDNIMIYGIGSGNVFSNVGENNVVTFFHFDPDKTELTDDGALSFDIYDLLVKKIDNMNKSSGGDGKDSGESVVPIGKPTGNGFNFGCIMR